MTEETKLLRAAAEATVVYQLAEQNNILARKAAMEEAWKAYDLYIWSQRYAP